MATLAAIELQNSPQLAAKADQANGRAELFLVQWFFRQNSAAISVTLPVSKFQAFIAQRPVLAIGTKRGSLYSLPTAASSVVLPPSRVWLVASFRKCIGLPARRRILSNRSAARKRTPALER